jgi:hypothetical protein
MTKVFNFVYQSVSNGLTAAAVANIVSAGRARNYAMNVRGVLIYDRGCFYQWLEGPQESINEIFQLIQTDSRHKAIDILTADFLDIHLFSDSFLKFVSRDTDISPYITHDIYLLSEKSSDMLLNPSLIINVLAYYGSLT